jgi:hypothetical protein
MAAGAHGNDAASSLFHDALSSFDDTGEVIPPSLDMSSPRAAAARCPGPTAAVPAGTQHRGGKQCGQQRPLAGSPGATLQSLPSDLTAAFVLLCSDEASQLMGLHVSPSADEPSSSSSSGSQQSSPGPGGPAQDPSPPLTAAATPAEGSSTAGTAAGPGGGSSGSSSSGACTPERQPRQQVQRKATRIDAILRRLTTVSLLGSRELPPPELPPWVPQPPLQFDEQGA